MYQMVLSNGSATANGNANDNSNILQTEQSHITHIQHTEKRTTQSEIITNWNRKKSSKFSVLFFFSFFYYYFQCSTHVNTTIFRYGLNIAFCSDFFLRTLCMSADSRTIFLPKRGRLIDILCWNSVFGVKTTTLYFDSIAPFNAYSRLKSRLNENPKVIR